MFDLSRGGAKYGQECALLARPERFGDGFVRSEGIGGMQKLYDVADACFAEVEGIDDLWINCMIFSIAH